MEFFFSNEGFTSIVSFFSPVWLPQIYLLLPFLFPQTNIINPSSILASKMHLWLNNNLPVLSGIKETQCWSGKGQQTSLKTSGWYQKLLLYTTGNGTIKLICLAQHRESLCIDAVTDHRYCSSEPHNSGQHIFFPFSALISDIFILYLIISSEKDHSPGELLWWCILEDKIPLLCFISGFPLFYSQDFLRYYFTLN